MGSDLGEVLINWEAPESDGGRTIDWYSVNYESTNGGRSFSTSVKGDELKLREFGVPVGAYRVSVVALSQAGTSSPSNAVPLSVG
jgi:hypothetical protein